MTDGPPSAYRPDRLVVDVLPELEDGVGLVTDDGGRVLGTVSDAAVRSRLLRCDDPGVLRLADVLDAEPLVVAPDVPDADVRRLLADRHARAVAVVDGDRAVGWRRAADVGLAPPEVTAVLLAGGRGERLQPLTFKVPKPLLTVGRTSVLERVLDGLARSHVTDVWLAVNYMADVIEERIGDGAAHGLSVRYLHEHEPLETAGPLGLLPERPAGPILVLNTDQITNLSFARMVDHHLAEGAAVTMASFRHEVRVPYGVIRLEGGRLVGLEEKPVVRWPCNAGFYVVDPSALDLVPPGEAFTMVELVQAVMARGQEVAVFPLVERWIDIGTPEELERALLWFATGEEV